MHASTFDCVAESITVLIRSGPTPDVIAGLRSH